MSWIPAPTKSGHITSPYGPRKAVRTTKGTSSTNHQGTDYRAPTGTNVLAVGDGTVTVVSTHALRGKYVTVQHHDGTSTLVQHLSSQSVRKGQAVTGGTVLGKAGATGSTAGAHVHLEAFDTATRKRMDPVPYLAARQGQQSSPGQPSAPQAPTQPPTGTRTLKFGDTGPDVERLQRVLNAWYPARKGRPALVPDGVYGDATRRRVIYLQGRAGITVDGIAGPQVRGVLGL